MIIWRSGTKTSK